MSFNIFYAECADIIFSFNGKFNAILISFPYSPFIFPSFKEKKNMSIGKRGAVQRRAAKINKTEAKFV